jgi:hypothetical protein
MVGPIILMDRLDGLIGGSDGLIDRVRAGDLGRSVPV